MADFRIVTTKQVRARMAMSPFLTDNDEALLSAIDAAQARIAADYGMVFEQKHFDDIFVLDTGSFNGVRPNGACRLLLSRPFVSDVTLSGFTVPLDTDLEKGIVYIPSQEDLSNVTVSYKAGFEKPEDAPSWLVDAVITQVQIIFKMGTPTNDSNEVYSYVKPLEEHVKTLLVSHHRNIGFAFKPLCQR